MARPKTKTVAVDERCVLGEHPEGGWRVSSSDGITEYRVWLERRVLRCECPHFAHKSRCPHLYPVAVPLGMAVPVQGRRTVRTIGPELFEEPEPLDAHPLVRLFG
jgi:hypothetical protein